MSQSFAGRKYCIVLVGRDMWIKTIHLKYKDNYNSAFTAKVRTFDVVSFCPESTGRCHIQMLGDDVSLENLPYKKHSVILA